MYCKTAVVIILPSVFHARLQVYACALDLGGGVCCLETRHAHTHIVEMASDLVLWSDKGQILSHQNIIGKTFLYKMKAVVV